MQIQCDKCGKKLVIPDEKIPANTHVAISCPQCKNRISLSVEKTDRKEGSLESVSLKRVSGKQAQDRDTYSHDYDDSVLDLYEDGMTAAIVITDDRTLAERTGRAIEELKYRSVPAFTSRDAIGKLRLHQFDLLIMNDNFEDMSIENNPIMKYLNHLSMSVRRRMFVTLISEEFKTMDELMAFALSVDLIINMKDIEKIAVILKHAISAHEKFYKVFTDTLAEIGYA